MNSTVDTGTTIIAMEFKDGVVIGADSRTSSGSIVVNRESQKISFLHDRIYVARSGSAADTQALTSYVKWYLSQQALELGDLPVVNSAASLMQLLCYQNKHFLLAGLIVAGWDKKNGGQVYQIPLGGSKIRSKYAIGGSGSPYITAYLQSLFKENMTKDECIDLVKKSVAFAVSIDGSSGGLVRVVTITQDNVEEQVFVADSCQE